MGSNAWLKAVHDSLQDDLVLPICNDGLIHCVPKSLSNIKTRVFYVPQVMSIGPYHFKPRSNVRQDEVESLKTQVSRKMHKMLPNEGLHSVIESFMGDEGLKKIQSSYIKTFPISKNVWGWMIARDACFLLEVLRRFSGDYETDESEGHNDSDKCKRRIFTSISRIYRVSENHESDESEDRLESSLSRLHRFSENRESDDSNGLPRIDSILSRKRHHPLLNDIVKDMFKLENQIPFWTLDKIRVSLGMPGDDEGFIWFETSLKNLSPVEVGPVQHRIYTKTHLLQLLHDFIVDKPILGRSEPISLKDNKLLNIMSSMSLIWKAVICILILFLFPLFTIWLLWHWLMLHCRKSDILIERKGSVPAAEELKSVGVKFKSLKNRGIRHIYFNSNNSTLYLPKFTVDDRCEAILRNLMALEICSEQEEKPITRYVILMNDLINTSRDVSILRREDIISHKLGSDEEVAQLWNSIIVSSCTEVPYDPINVASSQINGYIKKWWKVLWAQFRMAHCSKPWLVLSLFAGILLLILTIMQVICVFHSCLIK